MIFWNIRSVCIVSLLLIFMAWNNSFADAVIEVEYPPVPILGPASTFDDITPPAWRYWQREIVERSVGGGNFGISDFHGLYNRQQSRAFFNVVYRFSKSIPLEWKDENQGIIASCGSPGTLPTTPGTPSDDYLLATLVRINYFRAMAGVDDRVVLSQEYNNGAQAASLFQSKNFWKWMDADFKQIDPNINPHNPPSHWDCYTSLMNDMSNGNLSWGHIGYDAVAGQMQDAGSNNYHVGHRRWLLYPHTITMGVGAVDRQSRESLTPNYYPMASVIYTADITGTTQRIVAAPLISSDPALDKAPIAWPPAGYVPYPVVYPRWSFSYPGADFSNATVLMFDAIDNNASVPIEPEQYKANIGENTLVWIPKGLDPNNSSTNWSRPSSDEKYHVILAGVKVGGVDHNINYTVTIFDPESAGLDEVFPTISGNGSIGSSGATYTYSKVPFEVNSYQLREWTVQTNQGIEGAEPGTTDTIIDQTDSSYELIQSNVKRSGGYAFRMAHPTTATQSFVIDRDFVIESNSSLQFHWAIGWSTGGQVAKAEILLDGDESWITLFSNSNDIRSYASSFTSENIPLGSYSGRIARFRFSYETTEGNYFNQVDPGVGFYVDDIQVVNADEVATAKNTFIGSGGSFDYQPSGAGSFRLQVRAVPWEGFEGIEWGPLFPVTVTASPSCEHTLANLSVTQGRLNECHAAGVHTLRGTSTLETSGSVVIESGWNKIFTSGGTITLKEGFHAKSSSTFKAEIK